MTNTTAPASTLNLDDLRDEFARDFDRVSGAICDGGARTADALWVRVCDESGANADDPHAWTADDVQKAYTALAEIAENVSADDLARECRYMADDLAASLEADAMEAEAYAIAPYADLGAVTPFQSRALAIAADAVEVVAHMEAVGVRFDAAAKVDDAETYTMAAGGSALAIPSKLAATTVFQDNLATLAEVIHPRAYYPARIHRGDNCLMVLADMVPGDPMTAEVIGQIQPKHEAWIRPILRTGEHNVTTDAVPSIRVYVTAVTGGTPGKPTHGCNIVFTGAAQAIRDALRAEAREAAQEAAYGSGIVAYIDAETD
ncbi:hypothetical protein B1759_16715 [Rubrivirga sp. SAORIC476]|uniref:hypothetical protein n=1 Tax=Rubrivirga sp. SAORIC476 TaxID=1961794 RepID=UPI000BA91292|nr:hypothetical protein [Rubrivirga sp. SAORIC476]PAP74817.1 hypothetical protein B1759_16715 [Rubrivirga sp. SAORIC476]